MIIKLKMIIKLIQTAAPLTSIIFWEAKAGWQHSGSGGEGGVKGSTVSPKIYLEVLTLG